LLEYKSREFGVNLDWSSKPVYEWQLLGGPFGQPVNTRARLAIYNQKVPWKNGLGEFLIYFDRTVGVDIGWPDSKTWGDPLTDLATQELKKAVMDELRKAVKDALRNM